MQPRRSVALGTVVGGYSVRSLIVMGVLALSIILLYQIRAYAGVLGSSRLEKENAKSIAMCVTRRMRVISGRASIHFAPNLSRTRQLVVTVLACGNTKRDAAALRGGTP